MSIALVLFAIAAVASGAVLLLNQRQPGDGRRPLPRWLLATNFGTSTVALILIILAVIGVGSG